MTWADQRSRIADFCRNPKARFDTGGWDTDARLIKQTVSDLRDENERLRSSNDDPMTTETARMFFNRAIRAEAEVARLQAYIDYIDPKEAQCMTGCAAADGSTTLRGASVNRAGGDAVSREIDWGGCRFTDEGSVEQIDALIGSEITVMGEHGTIEAIWLKEGVSPWPGVPWPRPVYRVQWKPREETT